MATDDASLPLSLLKQIDRLCDQFEEACIAGQRPQIEHFLGQLPQPERSVLLLGERYVRGVLLVAAVWR